MCTIMYWDKSEIGKRTVDSDNDKTIIIILL